MNERLARAIEDRTDDLVALTSDLIRFPTVNPPGDVYTPCAEFIARRLEKSGFETRLIRGEGGTAPDPEKIMQAGFKLGDCLIMASDGNCQGKTKFDGFSLALTVKEKAEAERLFAALGDGGEVCAPMTETFFSPAFGMVLDRFGVSWMVLVEQECGA